MGSAMGRGDEKLASAAEFADRSRAEEAWALLAAAGIPAAVVTDPAPFGGAAVTRVEVARGDVDAAQRLIRHLVRGAGDAPG